MTSKIIIAMVGIGICFSPMALSTVGKITVDGHIDIVFLNEKLVIKPHGKNQTLLRIDAAGNIEYKSNKQFKSLKITAPFAFFTSQDSFFELKGNDKDQEKSVVFQIVSLKPKETVITHSPEIVVVEDKGMIIRPNFKVSLGKITYHMGQGTDAILFSSKKIVSQDSDQDGEYGIKVTNYQTKESLHSGWIYADEKSAKNAKVLEYSKNAPGWIEIVEKRNGAQAIAKLDRDPFVIPLYLQHLSGGWVSGSFEDCIEMHGYTVDYIKKIVGDEECHRAKTLHGSHLGGLFKQ